MINDLPVVCDKIRKFYANQIYIGHAGMGDWQPCGNRVYFLNGDNRTISLWRVVNKERKYFFGLFTKQRAFWEFIGRARFEPTGVPHDMESGKLIGFDSIPDATELFKDFIKRLEYDREIDINVIGGTDGISERILAQPAI